MKTTKGKLLRRLAALLVFGSLMMAPLECSLQHPPLNTETVVGVAIAD